MTHQDSTSEDTESDNGDGILTTRRAILAGGGLAAAGWLGGTYLYGIPGRTSGHQQLPKLSLPGSPTPTPGPPETVDETPTPNPGTPWDKDELVFTLKATLPEHENRRLHKGDAVGMIMRRAARYWNNYILVTEDFDLTLKFERNPSDPDIVLNQARRIWKAEQWGGTCEHEHTTLADVDKHIYPWTCNVETLTEQPEETPVQAMISFAGAGGGVLDLLTRHVLGRFIGYQPYQEPAEIMHPKNLAGYEITEPDTMYSSWTREYYYHSWFGWTRQWQYYENIPAIAGRLEQRSSYDKDDYQIAKNGLKRGLEELTPEMEREVKHAEENLEKPVLADAIRSEILNGPEFTLWRETIDLLDIIMENELPPDSDEHRQLLENLNLIMQEYKKYQRDPISTQWIPWDRRAHQKWASVLWEKYKT